MNFQAASVRLHVQVGEVALPQRDHRIDASSIDGSCREQWPRGIGEFAERLPWIRRSILEWARKTAADSTVFGLFVIFPVRISAWFFLGFWFLYQLFEANFGLFGAKANGGGDAFFAHVGGFIFGVAVAAFLSSVGRVAPQGGGQLLLRASA
jgi:membrane associated rhomboid family serine protease